MFFKKRKSKGRKKAFKFRYNLTKRQPISDFENKMAKGMINEGKEVWVTSFCSNGISLTATATVGTKYSCSHSDNYYNWPDKCLRIGANEIRVYHNHPNTFGKSFASKTDIKSDRFLSNFLKPYNINYKSFLVYQRMLGGYAIKEIT